MISKRYHNVNGRTKRSAAEKSAAELWKLTVACGLVAAIIFLLGIASSGSELLGGEGDTAEHFAGILGAAGGIGAVLGGQAVVQYRDDQLSRAFQPDDGELPQGDEEPPFVPGEHQFLVKLVLDKAWNGNRGAVGAGTVANLPHLGA